MQSNKTQFIGHSTNKIIFQNKQRHKGVLSKGKRLPTEAISSVLGPQNLAQSTSIVATGDLFKSSLKRNVKSSNNQDFQNLNETSLEDTGSDVLPCFVHMVESQRSALDNSVNSYRPFSQQILFDKTASIEFHIHFALLLLSSDIKAIHDPSLWQLCSLKDETEGMHAMRERESLNVSDLLQEVTIISKVAPLSHLVLVRKIDTNDKLTFVQKQKVSSILGKRDGNNLALLEAGVRQGISNCKRRPNQVNEIEHRTTARSESDTESPGIIYKRSNQKFSGCDMIKEKAFIDQTPAKQQTQNNCQMGNQKGMFVAGYEHLTKGSNPNDFFSSQVNKYFSNLLKFRQSEGCQFKDWNEVTAAMIQKLSSFGFKTAKLYPVKKMSNFFPKGHKEKPKEIQLMNQIVCSHSQCQFKVILAEITTNEDHEKTVIIVYKVVNTMHSLPEH